MPIGNEGNSNFLFSGSNEENGCCFVWEIVKGELCFRMLWIGLRGWERKPPLFFIR